MRCPDPAVSPTAHHEYEHCSDPARVAEGDLARKLMNCRKGAGVRLTAKEVAMLVDNTAIVAALRTWIDDADRHAEILAAQAED